METNLFNGMSALGELRRSAERQLWRRAASTTMPKVRFLDRRAPNLRPGRVASRRSLDRQRITEFGWFADLPARPASPRRDKHSTDETGGAPSAALSISVFCVLGRPNVTALWRVLLLPWMGQWILASIRSCGQAPRLSRKRACHDDASVQQGRSITRAHLRARTPTSRRGTTARNMRDNAPPNEQRVRQTAQRAGPAWANTAKCCEQ